MIHTEQRAGGFDAAASVESARMHAVGTLGAFTGEITGTTASTNAKPTLQQATFTRKGAENTPTQ
jgi:hypothetical protein